LDVIQSLPEQANSKIALQLVEIANSTEDADVLEKTLLALGVCGDHSEPIVKVLQKSMDRKDVEDSIHVTAALVLGKQGTEFSDGVKESLAKCEKQGATQSFRTACKLSLQEFEARKPAKRDVAAEPTANVAKKDSVKASPTKESTGKDSAKDD
jgi:hypothetical protein